MRKIFIAHAVWLALSSYAILCLMGWTYNAFYPPIDEMEEAFSKPWRAPSRLAFSTIISFLLLITQGYIAKRQLKLGGTLRY